MKEHPILFSGPMVQALLANRKTVTRRLSKQWLKVKAGDLLWVRETWASPESDKSRPGRIAYDADGVCGCWVGGGENRHFVYHGRVLQASGYRQCFPSKGSTTFGFGQYTDLRSGEYPSYRYGWRPSIHMPRWASRITLRATEDARVERLQGITDAEAEAEGITVSHYYCDEPDLSVDDPDDSGTHRCQPREDFRILWGRLHAKPGERWEDNPEVVRIGFERCGLRGVLVSAEEISEE